MLTFIENIKNQQALYIQSLENCNQSRSRYDLLKRTADLLMKFLDADFIHVFMGNDLNTQNLRSTGIFLQKDQNDQWAEFTEKSKDLKLNLPLFFPVFNKEEQHVDVLENLSDMDERRNILPVTLKSILVLIFSNEESTYLIEVFHSTEQVRKNQVVEFLTQIISPVKKELEKLFLTENLERNIKDLRIRNTAKTEFLSNMSHELRTPLNAIIGFIQIIQYSPGDIKKEHLEYLGYIIHAGQHLLSLINEILELSKIESGKLKMKIEKIPLNTFLSECVMYIEGMAKMNEIILEKKFETEDDYFIFSDKRLLNQIIINLLSNAVKYNIKGGRVTLFSKVQDHNLVISVKDTGLGIPEEKMNRLFTPFERLGAEATKIEGTGIGLALVKKIVEQLNGKLGVRSLTEKGSDFWFSIPVEDEQGEQNSVLTNDLKTKIEDLFKRREQRKIKILSIEDNPVNTFLFRSFFEDISEIQFFTAENAEMGNLIVMQEKPDIILMDLNLPGMNGIQAAEKIKNTAKFAHIPIFAITGEPNDELKETLKNKKVFESVFTKPLDLSFLVKAILSTL